MGCSSSSRKIQQQVENLAKTGQNSALDTIIQKNFHSLLQLTSDKYGNYLMQLLVQHCGAETFERIIEQFRPQIVEHCFN